jgi:hypothetical protein
MVKPKVSTVLWMVLAWMLSMPLMAEEVKKSPVPLAEMSVSPTRIDWTPSVKAQRWVLTLSGPDEFFLRREAKAGKALFLNIFDSEGDRLADGSYTWELKSVSKSPAGPRRQSGSFSIQDGSFAETPRDTAGDASKPPLVLTTAEDSIETGNLIVQQNACIGDECGTTDANFSVLKLKSVNPNILFDGIELPEGGGGSLHDWGLFVNHSNAAQFSIVDFNDELSDNSALIPFSIVAGAPTNSLYIAGNGNLGLGTSTPTVRLDVKASGAGKSAARVQNSSSTGYSGIEYLDNHGNVDLFFGIDNTSSTTRLNSINSNPIVLLTNGTERMRVTAAGSVGIGTAIPGSKLDIEANAAGAESARVTNLSASGFSGFSYFDESTALGLYIGLDNANNTTRINSVNNNPIVILTNGTERIRFPAPGGNVITAANGAFLSAGGVWTSSSSRESKRDIVELSGSDALEALQELNPVTFRYKEEPDEQYVGFIAEDLPDLVATQDHKHMSPTDVVAVLTKVVKDQQKTIDELSIRLADLEALLAASRPKE